MSDHKIKATVEKDKTETEKVDIEEGIGKIILACRATELDEKHLDDVPVVVKQNIEGEELSREQTNLEKIREGAGKIEPVGDELELIFHNQSTRDKVNIVGNVKQIPLQRA